jgi:hypothetical protein
MENLEFTEYCYTEVNGFTEMVGMKEDKKRRKYYIYINTHLQGCKTLTFSSYKNLIEKYFSLCIEMNLKTLLR